MYIKNEDRVFQVRCSERCPPCWNTEQVCWTLRGALGGPEHRRLFKDAHRFRERVQQVLMFTCLSIEESPKFTSVLLDIYMLLRFVLKMCTFVHFGIHIPCWCFVFVTNSPGWDGVFRVKPAQSWVWAWHLISSLERGAGEALLVLDSPETAEEAPEIQEEPFFVFWKRTVRVPATVKYRVKYE